MNCIDDKKNAVEICITALKDNTFNTNAFIASYDLAEIMYIHKTDYEKHDFIKLVSNK